MHAALSFLSSHLISSVSFSLSFSSAQIDSTPIELARSTPHRSTSLSHCTDRSHRSTSQDQLLTDQPRKIDSSPIDLTDVNYGERFGSNLNTPDSQLEAQEKILQNQIKMLQSQLHLVQNSRAEKSMDTTVTASSDYKGKAVASSSSSCVSDCGRHGESEETEKR